MQEEDRQGPAPAARAALLGLDAAVSGRILLFGSPPPRGRDLDLLVRPPEAIASTAWLTRDGFANHGHRWVKFERCTASVVDLVPADSWGLPDGELSALFEDARPWEDAARVVRPAPHHVLLIAARRLIRTQGGLEERRRTRVAAALAEDARAWELARRRAPAWGASAALDLLFAAYARDAPVSRRSRAGALVEEFVARGHAPGRAGLLAARALAPVPRRSVVVTLSGLDGAGKSTHAATLQATLDRLGVEATVVWSPFGGGRTTDAVAVPAKWVLRRVRGRPAGTRPSAPIMSDPAAPTTGLLAALREPWAVLVAALDAFAQRRATLRHALRGRVIIFDRQLLDSVVRMRVLYGEKGRFRWHRRLMRGLAPRPRVAYLLEIRPETSLARKDDRWSLDELRRHAVLYAEEREALGVTPIDGERSNEAICAEIAAEVWRVLRQPARQGVMGASAR
jgi:thymidylate kinase